MAHYVKVLLLLILCVIAGCVNKGQIKDTQQIIDHEYTATLSTDKKKVSFNEYIECSLSIRSNRDSGMVVTDLSQTRHDIIYGKPHNLTKNQHLAYVTLKVIPKQLGINLIGPFSIEFEGKKYISNSLNIKVHENNFNENEQISVVISPTYAKPRQPITVKITVKNLRLQKPITPNIDKFKAIGKISKIKTSSSINIKNGRASKTIVSKFTLAPHKEGVFLIDRNLFFNIPKGIPFRNNILLVADKKFTPFMNPGFKKKSPPLQKKKSHQKEYKQKRKQNSGLLSAISATIN